MGDVAQVVTKFLKVIVNIIQYTVAYTELAVYTKVLMDMLPHKALLIKGKMLCSDFRSYFD